VISIAKLSSPVTVLLGYFP